MKIDTVLPQFAITFHIENDKTLTSVVFQVLRLTRPLAALATWDGKDGQRCIRAGPNQDSAESEL